MGRRRWRLDNTITNISPMMEKKRHVAIILSRSRVYVYRAIDASVTNKNLSRSSVKDVENSLHDVHVSVDSRDMGIDGLWGCLLVPEVSFLCCMMIQSIISYHSGLTNNTSSSFQQRLVLWMEVSK